MPFCYKLEYNCACNCHPEIVEVEYEAETLEELGFVVKRAAERLEQRCYFVQLDLDKASFRRALTSAEKDTFGRSVR